MYYGLLVWTDVNFFKLQLIDKTIAPLPQSIFPYKNKGNFYILGISELCFIFWKKKKLPKIVCSIDGF